MKNENTSTQEYEDINQKEINPRVNSNINNK